jgi:hypothetical protein
VKFSIRDVFWLTLVVGILLAWYIDSGSGYKPGTEGTDFSKLTEWILHLFGF